MYELIYCERCGLKLDNENGWSCCLYCNHLTGISKTELTPEVQEKRAFNMRFLARDLLSELPREQRLAVLGGHCKMMLLNLVEVPAHVSQVHRYFLVQRLVVGCFGYQEEREGQGRLEHGALWNDL